MYESSFVGYVNYCVFKKKYDIHVVCMNEEVESARDLSWKEMKQYTNERTHVSWYFPDEIGEMI